MRGCQGSCAQRAPRRPGDLKKLTKDKEISEDEERRAADEIQKLTDKFVAEVDAAFKAKEKDLMAV